MCPPSLLASCCCRAGRMLAPRLPNRDLLGLRDAPNHQLLLKCQLLGWRRDGSNSLLSCELQMPFHQGYSTMTTVGHEGHERACSQRATGGRSLLYKAAL